MDTTLEARQAIKSILTQLDKGELSYEDAKQQAEAHITVLNKAIKDSTDRLNKKYGVRRKPAYQDFTNLRRSRELL